MNADRRPETVSELYPSPWLKPGDLQGKATDVTVSAVHLDKLRQFDGSQQWRAILSFQRATKRLILNRTQCRAMAALSGSEQFGDWVGQRVRLSAGRAPNGKDTLVVSPAPPLPAPAAENGGEASGQQENGYHD